MGKNPAFQFYPSDWLGDPELQSTSAATRGIWANLLCYMWWSRERGTLENTSEELQRLANCTTAEWEAFLEENSRLKFADVTLRNKIVTVTNRRMMREERVRELTRLRVKKFRNAACNANITTHSSSTSSTSSSTTNTNTLKRTPSRQASLPIDTNGNHVKELVLYWYQTCLAVKKVKLPEAWSRDSAIMKIMLKGRDGDAGVQEVKYCIDSFLNRPPREYDPHSTGYRSGKCTLSAVLASMDVLLQRKVRGERP